MADESFASQDPNRAKKYHEGWVHHKPLNGKDWTKYWIVLRGRTLFIFHNQKTAQKSSHVGTLLLGPDVDVRTMTDNKRKTFKFELYTVSPNGQKKVNRFKFDRENDRDVWKSFILGVSTGAIPRDVHLLPGQLKDVVEAIGDYQNTPPPLPSLPRPSTVHRSPSGGTLINNGSTRSYGSTGSGDSDGSGSFRSHLTKIPPSRQYSDSTPTPSEVGGTVQNLRQLYRRQTALASKTIANDLPTSDDEGDFPTMGFPSPPRMPSPPPLARTGRQNSYNSNSGSDSSEPVLSMSEFSFGKPTFGSASTPARDNFNRDSYSSNEESDSRVPFQRPALTENTFRRPSDLGILGVPKPPPLGGPRPSSPGPPPDVPRPPAETFQQRMETLKRQNTPTTVMNTPPTLGRTAMPPTLHRSGSSSDSVHQFFGDPDTNRNHPPWFFENCSREMAESILTVGKRYGNVLMRESVTFKNTGSYVISMRREVAGGTQINHYEVMKVSNGFKINVDNDHSPMRSLSDVMKFFTMTAGPGSQPIATNDLNTIGLPGLAKNGRGRGHYDDQDSGFDDPADRYDDDDGGRFPTSPLGAGGTIFTRRIQNGPPTPPAAPPAPPMLGGGGPPPPPPPPPPPLGGLGPPPGVPPLNRKQSIDQDMNSFNTNRQNLKLNFQGNIPPEMFSTAKEIEYGMRGTSQRESPGPYNDPSLNMTVPAKNTPSETLQRNFGQVNRDMEQLYLNEGNSHDDFDNRPNMGGPPPPPPPPPAGLGGFTPPPPPLPGGHPTLGAPTTPTSPGLPPPTPPKPLNPPGPGSTLRSYGRRASETSDSGQAFNTVPSPGGGRGMPMIGANSFENELKNRLVSQREQIYSDGNMTILKSNWN